jgi:hypothetical protein
MRLRKHARTMRRIATDAERKLWFLLRDRRLDGIKFRRQVPFKNYILDFVCFERDYARRRRRVSVQPLCLARHESAPHARDRRTTKRLNRDARDKTAPCVG